MSQFNFSFSPLLPWPVLLGLGVLALGLIGLDFYARGSGSFLRALGLGLLLLAMTGPALVREDRNPLKEVVAVVVDQSGSQTIGERTAQTEKARAELEKRLNALGNVEVRVIESGRTDSEADGTTLFTALNSGLADVPLERLGGVFMITDGVVDDIESRPTCGALDDECQTVVLSESRKCRKPDGPIIGAARDLRPRGDRRSEQTAHH